MSTSNNIQAELESLGATLLSGIPVTNPYQVPDGYFTQFGATLPGHLHAADAAPELSLVARPELPFSMPAGFFEQFSDNILGRIRAEEQSASEDASAQWPRKLPYNVPAGYFAQLPESIIKRVRSESNLIIKQRTTKKIALFRTMRVAASVALIIFAGLGIMRYNMPSAMSAGAATKIDFSGIPKSAITEYINQNIDDFDMEMILNNLPGKTAKISSHMDVSSADIEAYLEDNG